ncbi:ABC transporter substrate-binding protein [Geothrix sp. PMB-07]|uniref:ABC transporter substrate-binding protein n=1 Tax=Geothrix sp. PMB-07 TaxID=3068640 RepID=UPI002740F569|nr:ABC transporter substrate-binding protein [Geothrix sp. PMB-07]WLT33213.1 ABC transporter substrate-binding protein [Geothrix sp. PMB-07]
MMHWRTFAFTLSLLSGLWAGGDVIHVAVNPWTTLNPLILSQDTDVEMADLLFDRLVTIDAKGAYIPELLESWKILPGGREVILKLRPGMTWHDGTPIEAEDLVFTWKALRLPRVRQIADTAGGVTSFEDLKAEDAHTVRIRLRRPRGTLLSDLYNFIPVPRHRYEVGPKPLQDAVNFAPIGSGPYRVVGKGSATEVRLERWDGYRGAHPGQATGFILMQLGNVKALSLMQQDQLHYAGVGSLRYYLVRKGAQGAGLVQAVSVPLATFDALILNCDSKHSVLGDPTLRQALYELLPWEEQAKVRRFFPARLSTSFWPPETWAYDPTPRSLPQPERAAALMEAAGWKLGADGLRHDAKGRPLSLEMYDFAPPSKLNVSHQLVIQAAKVGVRINLHYLTYPEVMAKAQGQAGDIWTYGWALSLDPDLESPLFTREGLTTKANLSGYLNPEMDRLFDQGRHTQDQEARKQIYRHISEIIFRDKPIIPINYFQQRVLVHRRLKGVTFNQLGQPYGFWPGRRNWKLEP